MLFLTKEISGIIISDVTKYELKIGVTGGSENTQTEKNIGIHDTQDAYELFSVAVKSLCQAYHWINGTPFLYTLLDSIRWIEQSKNSIATSVKRGIMSNADAAFQIEMLNEQQLKLKEQLINQVHICKDGTPRKIDYKKKLGLWKTSTPVKGESAITGKTKEVVLDKLMEYYGLSILNYTLHDVFEEAIKHKDKTESVSQETLYHLKSTYARFISLELGDKPIKAITCDILAEYTLNMLRTAQRVNSQGVTIKVKRKAFLDYKCVLNLTFQYAMDKDLITVNPLAKFKNKTFLKECDCNKAVSEDKIFSEEEIDRIKSKVRSYMTCKRYDGYFINGYAILLSIEMGIRVGEIPSLKWSDIKGNCIHIHSQQLSNRRKGGKEYYYADWTKDEKGLSNGGRKFPLTKAISDILDELKAVQESKGIHSEFVFCNIDGEWIKTDAYITCLRRMLASLGFDITNNHAFRMSLNSNVLAGKLNLPVAKRAELLGHSVETNMMYYTFATKDDMDDLVDMFNSRGEVSPRSHLKLVKSTKEKSLETANFKAL